jgi:orotate phosphoribosyltransferase
MSSSVSKADNLLNEVGAVLSGHFLLTSGAHSDKYVQAQKLLQYPRYGLFLAQLLIDQVLDANIQPNVVIGPAMGAIHFEVMMAQALDHKLADKPIRGLFAERPNGYFELRRGMEIANGEKVLVVEDVTTTGGSVKQIIDLVHSLGGTPVAACTVIDRSGGNVSFGIPFFSLVKLAFSTYEPENCPLCQEGIPCIKPGSKKIP